MPVVKKEEWTGEPMTKARISFGGEENERK